MKPDKNNASKIAKYTGLGIQMLAVIALGTWLGAILDGDNPSFPIYKLVFSLLSVFIALYLVIKEVIQDNK